MKGLLFLTSTGFRNPEVLNISLDHLQAKSRPVNVALIVTAAEGNFENPFVLRQKGLIEAAAPGVRVNLVDTDKERYDFSSTDLIFIAGGNSFKLLKSLRDVNFNKTISECLKRGGVVVGASAGALVLGPSVAIANEVTPDNNEVGLVEFKGLEVVNMIIYPHYCLETEPSIVDFEKKYGCLVQRLDNDAFVLFAL